VARWLTLLFALSLAAAAQEKSAELNPVSWKAAVTNGEDKVKPGGRFNITLTARIAEGWHLYSMKKLEGGPIPTTISMPVQQPFRMVGVIEAPVGYTSFEEAFGMEVEYYFDEVEFVIHAGAYDQAQPGKAKAAVEVRYQVCDNKQCLPPKTVKVEVPLEITAP
jgi:DsbC/DsbD-like thiol-disulfide interchange protein